jgi:DNA polymerase
VASRDEILRELHVAPEWRLRRRDVAASQEAGVPPEHVAIAPLPAASTRLERIAALGWDAFAADVEACTACGLCRTRNRAVPGVGDVRAQWMLIGEAPGAEEDARGEPFVGQAGKLLDNMLGALGMNRRDNVYIANVLKCRPPGNRTPVPVEVDACRPYLERQIALIRPRLIVALGKSAASLLLGTDASIASLRGRVHRVGDVPLVVTYHPAYLLRSLQEKAKAWEDLLFARRTLAASLSEADAAADE